MNDLSPPTLSLLVIGYGNPLRGDDALGWRAAEHLARLPELGDDPLVRIETVHQLTPEIAETIANATVTIFIDAAAPLSGETPGTLRCEEVPPGGVFPEKLGHHLTPDQALAFAESIYDARPRAYLVTVTAESFDYGAELTPEVAAAIPRLAEWILEKFAPGAAAV